MICVGFLMTRLSTEEKLRLVIWIDANAPYHDQFINKRAPRPAYDLAADRELLASLKTIHERRCSGCHRAEEVTRLDWINIHDAKQSLFLTAPLAKAGGGTARCTRTVYAAAQDADYRVALTLVSNAVDRAWANPRRDLATLRRLAAPRTALSGPSGSVSDDMQMKRKESKP